MEIQTVRIIGMGALGTLFGHQLAMHMPMGNLQIIADPARIARYQRDGFYCNDELCDFQYVTPEEASAPADLILIAVKALQLDDALKAIRRHVGEKTLILSLLNGITSEGIIGQAYGADKVINCVAYGMDAVRDGNRLTFHNMGKLAIGPHRGEPIPENVQRVARFFETMAFPHQVDAYMEKRMWGKFMLNVGVNQTVALFGPNYRAIQTAGAQRDTMVAAMREVIQLSNFEGVNLTEEDLAYWLNILASLNPEGKPSMRQDVEAKRLSEVSLFAGTVLALAEKHGMQSPVNQRLHHGIREIEAGY